MKELSIEQKAQAYDEALEIINDYYQKIKYSSLSNVSTDREVLEKAFPQLKEGEDEKVREELIKTIEQLNPTHYFFDSLPKEEIIAWLEKQCEQTNLANKEYWRGYREGKQEILDKYAEFGKQGEQKPIDEAEPKFKQGEWIIRNNEYTGIPVQVIEFKGYYRCDLNGEVVTFTPNDVHNNFHLWTIKDAKDGDILMANAPFIFNGNLEGGIGCPGAHCGINTLGKFQIPTNPKHWTGHTIAPATKEQRDTLMKAMADAGYTFDFEKKELKKIEQKPAWSEEDEKIIKRIDSLLYSQCKIHGSEYEEIHNWFKSLRPQPNYIQTKTDNRIRHEIINYFDCQKREEPTRKEKLDEWIEWLISKGKLPITMQQDNNWIERIEDILDWAEEKGRLSLSDCQDYSIMLSSFKHQNAWKPSDEQMEALTFACIKNTGIDKSSIKALYELKDQLKKLREE